jgi:hypothetical protein
VADELVNIEPARGACSSDRLVAEAEAVLAIVTVNPRLTAAGIASVHNNALAAVGPVAPADWWNARRVRRAIWFARDHLAIPIVPMVGGGYTVARSAGDLLAHAARCERMAIDYHALARTSRLAAAKFTTPALVAQADCAGDCKPEIKPETLSGFDGR